MPRSPDTRKRPRLGRIGRTRLLIFLAVMGPGLITANSDNDAGGITTWSVVGAHYGYSLLWVLLLITPILAVTQEMGARMGVVTGKGLAALIRERFSLKITAFAMLAMLIANLGTTIAEFSGVAAAFSLAHIPPWLCVPPVALGVWLLITRGSLPNASSASFCPSRRSTSPTSSPASWRTPTGARPPTTRWCPSITPTSIWLLTVIAAIGTTITPWGQFFIQATIVDKKVSIKEYVYTKAEVFLGAVFTDGIDFFIVVACAATLYKHGILVNTAQDAARALEPLAGRAAALLFGFGLLNVSILAAGILPLATAYAICEAFGFECGPRPEVRRRADLQRPAHVLRLRAGARWRSSRTCRSSR